MIHIKKYLSQNTSVKQTIIKNSFWLLLSEFITKVLTFLTTLWVARYLGVEIFGVSNFIISFVGFFIIIVDFGLSNLIYREVSKNISEINKYFVQSFFLKIFLSLGVFLIASILIFLLDKTEHYHSLLLIYLLYGIFSNFNEFIRVFFRPQEHMQYEAYLKIGSSILFVGISFLFIYIFGSLDGLFLGYLVSVLIAFSYSLYYIISHLKIKDRKIDIKFIKNLSRMAMPFFFGGIFVYFYSDINVIILSFLRENQEVGIFSAPYRIIFYVYIVLGILSISFFKKLVDQSKNKEIFLHYIKKYTQMSLLLSTTFVIFCWSLGGYIVNIVYGSKYLDSILVLKILSFLVILKSLSYVYGTGLTALSKEYTKFWIQLVVAIINIILAFLCISLWGYMGGVVSLLCAESVLMILYRHYLYRYI